MIVKVFNRFIAYVKMWLYDYDLKVCRREAKIIAKEEHRFMYIVRIGNKPQVLTVKELKALRKKGLIKGDNRTIKQKYSIEIITPWQK